MNMQDIYDLSNRLIPYTFAFSTILSRSRKINFIEYDKSKSESWLGSVLLINGEINWKMGWNNLIWLINK